MRECFHERAVNLEWMACHSTSEHLSGAFISPSIKLRLSPLLQFSGKKKEPRVESSAPSPQNDQPNSEFKVTSESLKSHDLLQEMPDRVVELVDELLQEKDQEPSSFSSSTSSSGPNPQTNSGANIILNIWDFAGHAVYYTTHQVAFWLTANIQTARYEVSCS